jgi:hypothetical protein
MLMQVKAALARNELPRHEEDFGSGGRTILLLVLAPDGGEW